MYEGKCSLKKKKNKNLYYLIFAPNETGSREGIVTG